MQCLLDRNNSINQFLELGVFVVTCGRLEFSYVQTAIV